VTAVSVLERPLYSIAEAAGLLGLPSQTLKRWLVGWRHEGTSYLPVIRFRRVEQPDVVRWAEFVEAGFLREYRARGVSLQHLRPVIEGMRREFNVPYPLAHFKPLIDEAKRELVRTLQAEARLSEAEYIVRLESNQLQFAEPVRQFLSKVHFDAEGVARHLRPLGPDSPVVIDPEVSFGLPQIHGIRTEIVAEAVATGESVEDVAASWQLRPADVQAAVAWERSLASRRSRKRAA